MTADEAKRDPNVTITHNDDGWAAVAWVNPKGHRVRWKVRAGDLLAFLEGVETKAPAGLEWANEWRGR